MSGGIGITPDGNPIAIPDNLANDPVTKAVYDNIMGNIPKKPKITVYCNICSLEFSSQVVLETHLAGSKHQRKVKSRELMKSLEQTETGFEKDTITGVIRCKICDVTVNSPQLLATHVAGNKHQTKKGKRVNGEQDSGTPAKKLCTGATGQTNDTTTTTGTAAANQLKKKERPVLNITVPPCVTKLEDNKTGGKFLCNPCQAHCNSDMQLSQHLTSKKHIDKVSMKKFGPTAPGTIRGGGRGWKGNTTRGRGSTNARGGSTIPKWPTNLTALSSTSSPLTYTNTFADSSSLTSSFNDGSFGLSSLGKSTATDYGFGTQTRSTYTGRGSGGRGRAAVQVSYPRTEEVVVGRDASYGRSDAYGRVAEYPSKYEYHPQRSVDFTAYGRTHTEYAGNGGFATEYGAGYGTGHTSTRGMAYTYTQPLSQNFVSGGSIL